ncbi:MAG: hypothetical protein ACO306_04500 [Flavobacteriaceae bacterium]|jgi:hypothetical protein
MLNAIEDISAELRYLTELLEVREKIRAYKTLYPTQKKYASRLTYDVITSLMAREIQLKQYLEQ